MIHPLKGGPQKGRQKDKEFKVVKIDSREEKLKKTGYVDKYGFGTLKN